MIRKYEEMAKGIVVTYYMQDKKWRMMKRTQRFKGIVYEEWEKLTHG